MVSDKKIFMGISHEKRGNEMFKICSPLKLLSQSQPNVAEMICGWFLSKIVSGISDLRPRWPQQPNLIPFFSISSLAAILVESGVHRTQSWKWAIQGPFHQSLVAIGPVVSEEKIFM
jgi:hypothetical protein